MSERYPGGIISKTAPTLNPALGNSAPGVWTLDQAMQSIKAGTWPPYDPYFEYTTLLLHGNGTNGAQNNTFLDSSTNDFTITRNGNTTQGTFTPYGSNWSNYFDGSGDSLTAPSGACISGTGDFTVECWIFPTTVPGSYNIIGCSDTTNGLTMFGLNANGTIFYGRSLVNVQGTTSNSCTYNTWNHIAISRSSSTLKMFINGVQGFSGTETYSYASGTVRIGTDGGGSSLPYTGYISNFRIIQGSALYTAAFTPPTAPLTAITNTSLLTCQSNRFIDNSTNAFTITRNGDTSVQRFSPFSPSAAYAAGTIGGSGYFDGSGDYLTVSSTNAALDLGGITASLEMWIYPTTSPAVATQLITGGGSNSWSTSTGIYYAVDTISGVITFYYNASGSGAYIADTTARLNQWNHVVVATNATTISLFVNGTRVATTTATITAPTTRNTVYVGNSYASEYYTGYISNVRYVSGTGAYSAAASTITVPTSPLTAVSGTSLLLNFTNGGIIDNAMMNDLETVGNAQISTTQSKFGGSSMYFDGTGDYLTSPQSTALDLSGDFTVELWVYFSSVSGTTSLVGKWGGAGAYAWILQYISGTGLSFYTGSSGGLGTQISGAFTAVANTWYHLAVTRSSNSVRLFVNGAQVGSTTTNTNNLTASNQALNIGRNADTNIQYLTGYIDDLRITKGVARYTAAFTPQTSQWQDQ